MDVCHRERGGAVSATACRREAMAVPVTAESVSRRAITEGMPVSPGTVTGLRGAIRSPVRGEVEVLGFPTSTATSWLKADSSSVRLSARIATKYVVFSGRLRIAMLVLSAETVLRWM